MSSVAGKRIAIATGALVVLVLGAELWARRHPSFASQAADRQFARAVLEADPATGLRVRPGASVTLDGVDYAFSSLGTRSELPQGPEDGMVMLAVGDSYSLGWKERVQRAWPLRVERRIQSLRHRFRVVNASVPGANIESHVARAEALLDEVKPAVLVVGQSPDDALPVAPLPGRFDLALPTVLGELLAEHPRNSAAWFQALHREGGEGMARIASAYARLTELCKARQITCAVAVLSPNVPGAESFQSVVERLQELASRQGLAFIDTTEPMRENPAAFAVAAGDPRPDEEAHDFAGVFVATWLMESNLLPPVPTPKADAAQ